MTPRPTGRPKRGEAQRRRDELVRLLAEGTAPLEATRQVGMSAGRFLRLIGEDAEVRRALRQRA